MHFLTHKASCKEDMRFPYFLSVSISILNTYVCKLIYRRADVVILTPKHLTELTQIKTMLKKCIQDTELLTAYLLRRTDHDSALS